MLLQTWCCGWSTTGMSTTNHGWPREFRTCSNNSTKQVRSAFLAVVW